MTSTYAMTQRASIEDIAALPIDERRKGKVTTYSIWNGLEMLGGVVLEEIDPHHAEGRALFIAPGYQKHGIGTRLANHLLEQARLRGYKRVSLETGATDAFATARKLFTRLGFQKCGPFGKYGDDPDGVYMTLELD